MPHHPLAEFLERLAAAALQLAADLSARPAQPEMVSVDVPRPLAGHQRAAAEVLAASDGGLTAGEVAQAMGDLEVANVYQVLNRLEVLGVAEVLDHGRPRRWRLAPGQATDGHRFLAVVQSVAAGEWTTYADLAIAIRGREDASGEAERVLAGARPSNRHRILGAGGRIPAPGPFGAGAAEIDVAALLEREGVRVEQGRADPGRRLSWEELRGRIR